MEDITERLHRLVGVYIGDADIDDDLLDAIAEIERLRVALEKIMKLTNWPKEKKDHRLPVVKEAHDLARAALEKSP